MEREDLIKKWLDNNLNPQELEAFKVLDDYDSLIKLAHFSEEYKAPVFDKAAALTKIVETKKASNKNWKTPFLRVAALIAICFGTYYYTTTLDTNFNTVLAEKTSIELPDTSSVELNAATTITFNKKSWNDNRNVTLNGEAFFKVAKGSTFNVLTDTGKVTVLGTQFNVKQRSNYFEVVCYEGLVEVTYKNTKTKLSPGDSFLSLNGEIVKSNYISEKKPDWLNGFSTFKSIPLNEVLAELERQYNIIINAKKIDSTKEFTGKFPHDNLDIALKSILEPQQLNYTKSNKTIILTRE